MTKLVKLKDLANLVNLAVTMVNINIEIPGELHKRLRIQSAVSGITQKELVIKMLSDHVKNKKW